MTLTTPSSSVGFSAHLATCGLACTGSSGMRHLKKSQEFKSGLLGQGRAGGLRERHGKNADVGAHPLSCACTRPIHRIFFCESMGRSPRSANFEPGTYMIPYLPGPYPANYGILDASLYCKSVARLQRTELCKCLRSLPTSVRTRSCLPRGALRTLRRREEWPSEESTNLSQRMQCFCAFCAFGNTSCLAMPRRTSNRTTARQARAPRLPTRYKRLGS